MMEKKIEKEERSTEETTTLFLSFETPLQPLSHFHHSIFPSLLPHSPLSLLTTFTNLHQPHYKPPPNRRRHHTTNNNSAQLFAPRGSFGRVSFR
jgi:hypothetical protein